MFEDSCEFALRSTHDEFVVEGGSNTVTIAAKSNTEIKVRFAGEKEMKAKLYISLLGGKEELPPWVYFLHGKMP